VVVADAFEEFMAAFSEEDEAFTGFPHFLFNIPSIGWFG